MKQQHRQEQSDASSPPPPPWCWCGRCRCQVLTYRWGYLGKYDVVVTKRDEGGVLVLKGNEALLSPDEALGTWTSYGIALKVRQSGRQAGREGNQASKQ